MEFTATEVLGGDASPDYRIRYEWAQELKAAMAARGVNHNELIRRLDKLGVKVSRQAIDQWFAYKSSPRPHVQRAIGTALDIPARSIFKLDNLPTSAAS